MADATAQATFDFIDGKDKAHKVIEGGAPSAVIPYHQKISEAEDMARLALFLFSDASASVNGQTIVVSLSVFASGVFRG